MKYFNEFSLIFTLQICASGVESAVVDKRLHIHMKAQMSSKDINRAIIFGYSNIISLRLLFEIWLRGRLWDQVDSRFLKPCDVFGK